MPAIDPHQLAERVRSRRLAAGLTIREAARAASLSPATLSRLERGDYLPGRDSLIKLAEWLDMSITDLAAGDLLSGHQGEPQSTSEAIALHLRADKELSSEDAAALEQLFRVAYDTLRRRREADPA